MERFACGSIDFSSRGYEPVPSIRGQNLNDPNGGAEEAVMFSWEH
jgi:hypothetical protein